jgi:hypothetical protein
MAAKPLGFQVNSKPIPGFDPNKPAVIQTKENKLRIGLASLGSNIPKERHAYVDSFIKRKY